MEEISVIAAFTCININAVLGSVPPYVSKISGAVAILYTSFSPLPYLGVLLHCRLHFLICLSDCLS